MEEAPTNSITLVHRYGKTCIKSYYIEEMCLQENAINQNIEEMCLQENAINQNVVAKREQSAEKTWRNAWLGGEKLSRVYYNRC